MLFLGSDDYIINTACEVLYKIVEENESEVVAADSCKVEYEKAFPKYR